MYQCSNRYVCNAETVHRLCDQRTTGVPLHAKEQAVSQVSRLETRRLDAVRVLYHGDDRHEHHHTHDEGTLFTTLPQLPTQSWTWVGP